MLWQGRKAGIGFGGAPWRALGLGCACFVFALRAFAVPSAPVNLLATPANARVTVTWTAVIGATGYNVYRSLTPGGPYGPALATGLTAATYTDNAVSNDTTYYYVATAVDGTGKGPLSAEDPATPRAGTFVSGIIGSASSPITTTWTLAGSPYVIAGDVTVRGTEDWHFDRTSTLVIETGVMVLFEPGTGLFIGDDTGWGGGHHGKLQATGATLTSNRTSPAPGDWKGIRFGNTTVDGGANTFLNGCTVEWAGGSGALEALTVNLSHPELRNGTLIRQTSSGPDRCQPFRESLLQTSTGTRYYGDDLAVGSRCRGAGHGPRQSGRDGRASVGDHGVVVDGRERDETLLRHPGAESGGAVCGPNATARIDSNAARAHDNAQPVGARVLLVRHAAERSANGGEPVADGVAPVARLVSRRASHVGRVAHGSACLCDAVARIGSDSARARRDCVYVQQGTTRIPRGTIRGCCPAVREQDSGVCV